MERSVAVPPSNPFAGFHRLDGKKITPLEQTLDRLERELPQQRISSYDGVRKEAFIEAFTPFDARSDIPSNTILKTMERRLREAE